MSAGGVDIGWMRLDQATGQLLSNRGRLCRGCGASVERGTVFCGEPCEQLHRQFIADVYAELPPIASLTGTLNVSAPAAAAAQVMP